MMGKQIQSCSERGGSATVKDLPLRRDTVALLARGSGALRWLQFIYVTQAAGEGGSERQEKIPSPPSLCHNPTSELPGPH